MTATESAKAKFRSRNSSKNLRGEDEESPAKQQKRLSYGSPKPSSPAGTPRAKSMSQVKSTTYVFLCQISDNLCICPT